VKDANTASTSSRSRTKEGTGPHQDFDEVERTPSALSSDVSKPDKQAADIADQAVRLHFATNNKNWRSMSSPSNSHLQRWLQKPVPVDATEAHPGIG